MVEDWLLMRWEGSKFHTLSNAPLDTPLTIMTAHKLQRYFIEPSNQEAKSGFGWDEFRTTRLLAWEHQLALTILAHWFITQNRLEWARSYSPDPALSVANVRAMLRAARPLPQLTIRQAVDLVVKHLNNRLCSRKSRLMRITRL